MMSDANEINPLVLQGLLIDDSMNILSPVEIPEEFRGLTLDEIALIVVQKMDESIRAKSPAA
jgi:hypothetical protein